MTWLNDLDFKLRAFPPYWRLSRAMPRRTSPPPDPIPEKDAASFDADPFASVWSDDALAEAVALTRRIFEIANARGVPLMPFWGTLLGQVREGRILAWDDDIDLALFAPDHVRPFQRACRDAGLAVYEYRKTWGWYFKLFDPEGTPAEGWPWTFPFVDIFVYADPPARWHDTWPESPVPIDLVLPGRAGKFAGAPCWMPERPLEVLEALYPGWREWEKSSDYGHRTNRRAEIVATRRIVTDANGRKITGPSVGS